MKPIFILGILSLVLLLCGEHVSAGIRVVRDSDDMTKMEKKTGDDDGTAGQMATDNNNKNHKNMDDFRSIIMGALTSLRSRVGDRVKEDIDMFQGLINTGALDKTLDQVKTDLQGERPSIRKIITTFRDRASSDYSDLISRIVTGSQGTLEKFRDRAHELLGGRIEEGAKAVAAGIAELTGI